MRTPRVDDCQLPADESLLRHLLEIVGLRGASVDERVRVRVHADALAREDLLLAESGAVLVLVRPSAAACATLGLTIAATVAGPCDIPAGEGGAGCLRTLHERARYSGTGEPVLRDDEGVVWQYVPRGTGGVLAIGTELAADLLRFRQGDPAAAQQRPTEAMWGIAGERPNYLFERQLEGLPRAQQRQADLWAMFAARTIAAKARLTLEPVLPGGAAGAIVITGDDDQAYLEKYAEQLRLLQGHPVTYFLHPLTRHTPATLRDMFGGLPVELGIHPDALEAPQSYAALLKEQCAWFAGLTGRRATSLRNHGFLNDGYWGHLPAWREEGIAISSNVPGIDGQPVNGSLLPARMAWEGRLTEHWSVVTAIGDGVRYIDGGRPDEEAARCIFDGADAIRASGIPGVMVLNLHPQNVADTRAMHFAAVDVIRSGFVPWTMQDCLAWFSGRPRPRVSTGLLGKALDAVSSLWKGRQAMEART